MIIKIFDLIKIIDNSGEIMKKAETVTFFNDMCLFAPATLIDTNIKWEELDDGSVLARYTCDDITIAATLMFGEDGRLLNFISDDRYALNSNGNHEKIRWSTPIYEYGNFDGFNLTSKGEAIWQYDEGEFSYIRMTIKNICYD